MIATHLAHRGRMMHWCELNISGAKFFRGNKNIDPHFMSFLHIDMTQVVESFLT